MSADIPSIPPLNISAGPSGADGMATGSANGTTGEFLFGTQKSGWQDVAKQMLPILILGGVILWTRRR
jgi:hypothetical protein